MNGNRIGYEHLEKEEGNVKQLYLSDPYIEIREI